MNQKSANHYYPWFDWLRLALATIVVLSHAGALERWPSAAAFAVKIFFALSGWLIGGVLVKLPRNQLPRFYFNRALRIWSPYFLALLLLVAVSLLRDHVTSKWVEFVFYKVTFVYNLFGPRQLAIYRAQMPLQGTGNHFWSVNAEEQFYLLAPLLLVLLPRRFSQSLVMWVGIALLAWWTDTYSAIVLGILAAVVAHKSSTIFDGYGCRIISGLIVLASGIALASRGSDAFLSPIFALGIVLFLAVKGTRHSLGELAGGMSYPLYLNAWLATFLVNFFYKRSGHVAYFAYLVLLLVVSYALSAIMYWHIDRPILAQRPRLYTESRAKVVMAVAYGSVTVGICVGLILYHKGGL